MMHSAMSLSIMAEKGQPLFHDFLGMTPSEVKHREMSATPISSSTSLSSSRGFEENLNRVSSTKASLVTSQWPEATLPLQAGPVDFTAPSTSDPSSERPSLGNGVGLLAHGDKSSFCRPEVDSRSLGKKRELSTSKNNQLLQDCLQINLTALENSRGSKGEKRGRLLDIPTTLDDIHAPLQPTRQTSTCSTLLHSSAQRPDFMALNKIDCPVSLNVSAYSHSYLSHCKGFPGRNCSNASGDNASMPISLSGPSADEGSRTGLQMSSLTNVIKNVPGSAGERSTGVPGVSVGGTKFSLPSAGSDSSILKSHQIAASTSHQLTVFYGGQAHVFDDVPAGKADAIMALAGSNGRSWSTTYSSLHKPSESGVVPGQERPNSVEEVRIVKRGL